jgi:hypothetical protein
MGPVQGNGRDKRGRVSKCFAVAAVTLLLLVSFHVLNIASVSADGAASSATPFSGLLPAGTVEGISSPAAVQTSSPGGAAASTTMTCNATEFDYWTPYGTFIFERDSPESVSLISLNGTRLVQSAQFSLFTAAVLTAANATVVRANDTVFEAAYDVQAASVLGRMDVLYDFASGHLPKITATVSGVDPKVKRWNVVWTIVPDQAPRGAGGNGTTSIQASLSKLVLRDLKAELPLGQEQLKVDWTDAKAGSLDLVTMAAPDGGTVYALQVSFPRGQAVIDPTIVGSSSDPNPTTASYQRKTFMYNGYYWLFYNTGSAICYRTSTDGVVWSAEMVLPGGSTPASGSGFDVTCRNGVAAVGWINTLNQVMFNQGNLSENKIVWSGVATVATVTAGYIQPVSVAIGYDNSFWVAYFDYSAIHAVRSLTGRPGTFTSSSLTASAYGQYYNSNRLACVLLPISGSTVALLEACAWSNNLDYFLRVRYCSSGWGAALDYNIGMDGYTGPYYKSETFSAVATADGTIHVAYRCNSGNGGIKYTSITSGGVVTTSPEMQAGLGYGGILYPSLCLDASGVLHLYYLAADASGSHVYHRQKPLAGGSWSAADTIYTTSYAVKGLTAWAAPAERAAVTWSESSGARILFASMALPFGSVGGSVRAWARDGLSPYGTFFAQNGDAVSPGTGSMLLTCTDISIPGRGGVDLGVSRIYQQPRYFSKVSGLPLGNGSYPFSNLGRYWGLDLPWMDDYHLYLGGGARYLIQWGNAGNAKEFVCHGAAEFVLRDVTKGSVSYYEVITASGLRYEFSHSSPYRLAKISNLIGYDPAAATYTAPSNSLTLNYDGSNRLSSITDSCLSRSVSFTYDGSGYLSRITAPDSGHVDLTYTSIGGIRYLATATDQVGRVTSYAYDSSAGYLMSSVTYPSNAKVQWTYAPDNTPATEHRSWMVTSEATRNATTNVLIRYTSFSYRVINGNVATATLTSYDTNVLQGSTLYIFHSLLGSQEQIDMNSTGAQMRRVVTWFDPSGHPSRMDTYLGDSPAVNSTTLTTYDKWGNVVFTQDALGSKTYTAYVGAGASAFPGGQTLNRTGTGLILYDPFDDLDLNGWTRVVGDATTSFDVGADPHSPAVRITRTGSGGRADLNRTFAAQTSDFVVQSLLMTDMVGESRLQLLAGGSEQATVRMMAGSLSYLSAGNAWTTVAPCSANLWYDVALYVHPSSGTFDIYIDGTRVANAIPLRSSSSVDRISFQNMPGLGSMWFTNVRVYAGLTVTVNGLSTGFSLALVDQNNSTICSTAPGTSTITAPLQANLPPVRLVVRMPDGRAVTSPGLDVWGGDVYTLTTGLTATASFYSNSVKGDLHCLVAGSLTLQDYQGTVAKESYCRYDYEGNAIETRSRLGSGWIYTRSSYDQYGNVLSSIDDSGLVTVNDYSSSNGFTYPVSTRSGGRVDGFDQDTGWTPSKSSSNGNLNWFTAAYANAQAYSGTSSLQLSLQRTSRI